jgi:UDP-N-acetylmuramoyl-tripeptide--D-alanyl-D-alanine ligase
MIPLSLIDVATMCDGALADIVDPAAQVSVVVADSRDAVPGALFVAIPGARVDGHDFAPQAVAAGAVGVLGGRPTGYPTVVVDDPVAGLGRLAAAALQRLDGTTVVGVTGSSGKTSTKDLIAQVVDPPVVSPAGSYNTEVGLPLTVLRADQGTRVLVLEMGMRGMGHIRTLTRIAPPDISVVTNVGSAHIELLGTRDNIALAKGEIVEALRPDGVAILNADDHRVLGMRSRTAARAVTYGVDPAADVRAVDVGLDAQARPYFTLQAAGAAAPVRLALHGAHMVHNALAAAAVALTMGVDIAVVAERLGAATPRSKWRMDVTECTDGTIVINDAYNANPESTRAGLDALVGMGGGRRTWAVLGEMRELGESGPEEHRAVGAYAARIGVDHVVAVGAGAAPVAAGAQVSGSASTVAVASITAAVDHLFRNVEPGDVILVKASRSVGLDEVAAALLARGGA